MTFVVAMRKFFGYRDGHGLSDFAEEIKKLTQQDRVDLAGMLTKEFGEEVTPGTVI